MAHSPAHRHRRRVVASAVTLALTVVLAGCGSSSPSAGSVTAASGGFVFNGHPVSKQARMICQTEAAATLAKNLGTKTIKPPEQGWSDGNYTCRYTFPGNASFVLSVRDLATTAAAATYLNSLGDKLGRANTSISFGTQSGFLTPTGNVVVQKDSHVLIVDVSHLPKQWSTPPIDHTAAAETITLAIVACWKGDS